MPVLPKPDWCRACPGWDWSEYGPGMGFSSLEGYGNSGLFVVAEALGEKEEEDGLPLRRHGASGAVFRRALDDQHFDANLATLTNVIRCRPPDNELWGQPWTYTAISHCRHYLSGAIGQRKPTLLLALGDTPYQELVADLPGTLSEVRGFVLPSKYGIPMIATYHPAYIARGAWNLYGAFKQDVGRAALWAQSGVPAPMETDYELHPTIDDVHRFLADVLAHPEWPISYDVETAFMLGEKEPEDWRLKRLIQIQFSVRPGQAIVLPWDNGPYSELSKQILATPNPKWGWNSARSDDILLAANGCTIAGERHDLMLAWAHLQPDFTAKGDDRDGDEKGIPSKLMGLQSAASFYCPEVGPWKHLAHSNLQLYGAFDADYSTRCGQGIFRGLDSLGLMGGYREHKYELRFTLDLIGEHGLPVDRERQAALRVYTLGELHRLQTEIQQQVPSEVLSIHPKAGYKNKKKGKSQMPTVTYKNQPAIERTKGTVPLAGTKHVYTVAKVLWPEEVETFLRSLFIGRTLHVCCGKSMLGDVRLDMYEPTADIQCDASNMKGAVADDEFDTVLCDPPYNGKFQWNHDLLNELSRVAKQRIVFQHWFMPITPEGRWKKWQDKFALSAAYIWQPRTYFGRVQVISVLDIDAEFSRKFPKEAL